MSDIAAAAKALKDRHAALLRPERPAATARQAEGRRRAAERLDVARERLQGGPRPDAPQLTLDLGRGAIPELRADLRAHHSKRCDCHKPAGSVPCASCPFTTAQPGTRRPSNTDLGL